MAALCAVGFAAFAEPDAVQLWENGPYFATCNVGANAPQEGGYFFWWGDTVGYTNNGATVSADKKWLSVKDGKSIKFSDASPANTLDRKDATALADYVDANGNLKSDYDAATKHLGPPWRMMTKDELDKLVSKDYCQSEWVGEYKGVTVNGLVVKGKAGSAYEHNEVFFPAAGYGVSSSLNSPGKYCYSWSSTPLSDNPDNAWNLNCDSSHFKLGNNYRHNGYPVRPVKDPPPPVVAQFVKGGKVVVEFNSAAGAVKALDDAQYADIEEFRIGLVADTVFDFGGRTNRVVILNVGDVENTLKNVLLDCAGDYVVTGMVGTVVFGDGVRIEKETGFRQGLVELIIKGGLYKSDPSNYCEGGYFGARRCDANAALNGLYAILPEAEIAVTVSKGVVPTHYATLQDAFNLAIGENEDVTLYLFNNLELGTAETKLEGNKVIHLLPGEAGANTIKRVGAEPVIEIGREAKLEISDVIFDGANVTSEKPMIEVAGKTGTKFGWLIAGDGFVVSNAVGGAVHVGKGGKFELDGVAKIIENFTDGKPKNVIIEDSAAIQLTACGAVTDGNYAQIGVWSETAKFMVAGGQFGTVNTSYEYATDFADGDISVAKPWVGFINDLDGSLHHAAGAKIAAAGKKTYKRWVGGEYKETLAEGDYLISREKSIVSVSPELVWTARQDAPAAQPAPAVLDWTDTTLTLAVSNGCDYALVTSGSAETNWVSMVKADNTYAFARPAGGDYLCLKRYSITPSNIVSAATAYNVRIPAGTEDDPWLIGAENPEDVTAWTNGNEFVVSGDGTVSDLSKLASKVTAQKLTIKDATVTVAASDAFQGFGASGSEVSLTLPDNWQGDLPDEEGNWYGATVTLTAMPLTVKNVTFLQRYPWNGKVDVSCDLTGAGSVTLNVTVFTNGVKFCEATALAGETMVDLDAADGVKNGVKFVWDAAADLPAGFKAQGVKIKVTVKKYVPPPLKQHTVDVTLKSQSGAPVAGKVVFHLETGASAEISIGDDGTGRGEVPEGKGTWTVDAKYCATTPTTPTESTIDQDGLTINLEVKRETKDVDVVALFSNHSPHPPVPGASITWILFDDYDYYGEEITVIAGDDGKAQFKGVELGLWLEVWGEGSLYDPDFEGGWTYELDCETWLEPDEIIEDGVKELLFENAGGV